MVSVTSASRYITSASRYHLRHQTRPSMYIRGLIPLNFAVELVSVAQQHDFNLTSSQTLKTGFRAILVKFSMDIQNIRI